MEDLPQEFYTENSAINVEFLNNITEEITARGYPVSVNEIMSGFQSVLVKFDSLQSLENYI